MADTDTVAQPVLDLDALLASRTLLMVGGKGGVGKTTTASALAIRAADQGRKVLLVSTDPAHSLADAFNRTIGNSPTCLAPGLTALELDPDDEVEAYLERVSAQMRRFATPDQFRELDKQLRLSRQSPGAQEAALLERISRLIDVDSRDYDLLIFDTAPTGHTLRLLSLPEVMAAWTQGLLRHSDKARKLGQVLGHLTPDKSVDSPLQDPTDHATAGLDPRSQEVADTLMARQRLFHRARRQLSDAAQTAFIFVLTPERLPILETQRAVASLTDNGIPVAGAVVNRVLPETADSAFFAARHARQQRHMEELAHALGTLPRKDLALQEDDIQGLEAIRAFAGLLGNADH